MAQDREQALLVIAEASGARHEQIDWPVAVREALRNSQGGFQTHDDHQEVLRAIGVLIGMPHGIRLTKDARPQDGSLEVCIRALRQIADFGPEPVTEAMVDQAFEAAFPGLPAGMTIEEAKRRMRAGLEAVPSPARLQARGALMAIGELDEGAGT